MSVQWTEYTDLRGGNWKRVNKLLYGGLNLVLLNVKVVRAQWDSRKMTQHCSGHLHTDILYFNWAFYGHLIQFLTSYHFYTLYHFYTSIIILPFAVAGDVFPPEVAPARGRPSCLDTTYRTKLLSEFHHLCPVL